MKKKLKSGSKNWIKRHIKDRYVQLKRAKGYRSRSAFKLIEIDSKFNILKNNNYILDLGSAPGGWSQVISEKIKKGRILAIDILPMKKINNVDFILGDFLNKNIQSKIMRLCNNKLDTIVSDMASNTTGNKDLDSIRTSELCINAMEFSKLVLSKNGIFLSKFFMGSTHKEIKEKADEIFKKVIFYKPDSSRKDSREVYIFCKNIINQH